MINLDSTINLFQILKEIGLTAKETNVYLALHTYGPNPASIIAKKADLNRSSCYGVLNSLTNKKFAQHFLKNNISYFKAIDPVYVLEKLRHKKYKIDKDIESINNLIKHFESLKEDHSQKPNVTFFEGEDAIKKLMEDTLSSPETILAYASLDELTALFPDYWPVYYKRRTQKNIHVKAIYPANRLSYFHKKRDAYECRESRLIPPEFNFHLDIMIYNNKVAITSLKEKFGLLIESGEIYEAHKKIFNLIWEGTKKYDQVMIKTMHQKYEQTEPEIETVLNSS